MKTYYLKGRLEVRATARPMSEGMGQTVHFLFPQEWIKKGILPETPSIKCQINSLTLVEGVGKRIRSLQKGIRNIFIGGYITSQLCQSKASPELG